MSVQTLLQPAKPVPTGRAKPASGGRPKGHPTFCPCRGCDDFWSAVFARQSRGR